MIAMPIEGLPHGWSSLKLVDLCGKNRDTIVDGPFGSNLKRSHYQKTGVPVLKIQNIRPNSIELKKMDYVSAEKYDELRRHSFERGDIVMTKLGNPLGVSAIVENIEKGLIVADLVRIRPGMVNSKFLCYQLNSPLVSATINASQKGTTRPRINLSIVRNLPVMVPPMPEQEKIVEILEEQLSRLDAALASVRMVRDKIAQFRRSLLHVAFTGASTGHDTSTGTFPKDWEKKTLGDLVRPKYGKSLDKSKRLVDGQFPVVGSAGTMAFTDEPLVADDVIVVGRKGNVGDVQLLVGGAWPIDTVYYFTVPVGLSTRYFYLSLVSKEMKKLDSSTTTPSLRREDMESVEFLIPPFVEQEKIVEILEEQLSRLDASLVVVNAVEKRADALRRSLLHAAFTGKLTEQWREGSHV